MTNTSFTVKHVTPRGHTVFHATDRVEFYPKTDKHQGQVWVGRADGGIFHLDTGSIYVMNAAGKTIDAYHFGEGEVADESRAA